MHTEIFTEGQFKYYEAGRGQILLLLHGLFGSLSNFKQVIDYFSKKMKVSIPLLPLYELPPEKTGIEGLVNYLHDFIHFKQYNDVILTGNSLGGHIALMYTLKYPEKVKAIALTGSSGLFENSLGVDYPKKSDYDFVRNKTEYTFYNPATATKELVDEVYEIVNNREKAIRILHLARSALRNNLREQLKNISVPVMLIWGKNDRITPPFVGEEFHRLLPTSSLEFINKCGHAAMMEQPEEFNRILDNFISKIEAGIT